MATTLCPGIYRLGKLQNVLSIKSHLPEVEQLWLKEAMLVPDPQDLHPLTRDAAIAAQKCMKRPNAAVICGGIRKVKELKESGLIMEDRRSGSHLKNGRTGRSSGTPSSTATLRMQARNQIDLKAPDSARVTTRSNSVNLSAHK